MICRAAVGKTFIFPSKNITESVPLHEKPELMTGEFDSLFIYDEHYVSKEFKQNYIIYKASENMLPLYIVHFTINESKYRELREVNKYLCRKLHANYAKIILRENIVKQKMLICVSVVISLIITIDWSINIREQNWQRSRRLSANAWFIRV
jgi:hypothetical protein